MNERLYVCKICKGKFKDKDCIKKGKVRYCKKCEKERSAKEQIREFYVSKINNTVVLSVLNSVVKNLIEKKNVEAEYILFTLKYIYSQKLKINHPMGLHYYIDDKRIKNAYNQTKILQYDYTNIAIVETKEEIPRPAQIREKQNILI